LKNLLGARLPDGIFFEPKIQIWANLNGSSDGRCRYIFWTFGLFNGRLVYFMDILVYFVVICYILW
jgi:hypothetical protein